MLEKNKGCILVEKLISILLMEADFNTVNKLFVRIRIIKKAEATQEPPTYNLVVRKDCSSN